MQNEPRDLWLNLTQALALVIAAVSVYYQVRPPSAAYAQQSLLLLLGVLGGVALLFVTLWIIGRVNDYRKLILEHAKEIAELKTRFRAEQRFHDLDKRLSIIEFKNLQTVSRRMGKKGKVWDINPIIIIFIIILILFFFYLRSIGVF